MRLSLIIATRARPQPLRETLASLRACDPQPDEVVIVDGDPSGSAEPVVAELRADGNVPAVAYSRGVTGLPHQRNAGIDLARGEIVAFCDDDVDFHPDAFEKPLHAFGDPCVMGASGRVIEPTTRRLGGAQTRLRRILPSGRQGTMSPSGFPRRLVDADVARDIEFLSGCLMAARRTQAAALRFDEALPGYALAEDEDFGYRLSRLGRVVYVPDAVVHHKALGFGTMDRHDFNRRLVMNRAYLFRKNFDDDLFARLRFVLMLGILAGHRALNRDWRGLSGLLDGAWHTVRDRWP